MNDIASIVFVCVTMNHLGLVGKVESILGFRIPVIDCPKCASFWATLAFQLVTNCNPLTSLAVSFLASYSAIWLELIEGLIDTIYLKLYGTIATKDTDDTTAADASNGNSTGSVSRLRKTRKSRKAK